MTETRGPTGAHDEDRGAQVGTGPWTRLVVTGLIATVAAVAATCLTAVVATTLGVDFELPDGEQQVPVSGIGVMTGLFCAVGVAIAVALRVWATRPARTFVRTTVLLTAVSLVPPVAVGADAGTVIALITIHLVAASVMIPALARELRREPRHP